MIKIFAADLGISRNRAALLFLLQDQLNERKLNPATDNVLRTLTGQLLTLFAIRQVSSCPLENIVCRTGCFGKPELVSPQGYHFNRSHSGDLVVCAVAGAAVGVDVEQVRQLPERMIQAVFSRREISHVLNDFPDPMEGFCDRWTLKECYLKALGKGMPDSMLSFEIVKADGQWCVAGKEADLEMQFRQYAIREGYRLSVCSADGSSENNIEWVALDRLAASI